MGMIRGLSTVRATPKKRQKFASAEEKRQNEEYWQWRNELKASLKPAPAKTARLKMDYSHVRETPAIPSRFDTDVLGGTRKESRPYEGERQLLGIATLHKSNMVPVFSQEDAEAISKMRRG